MGKKVDQKKDRADRFVWKKGDVVIILKPKKEANA